jgi:cell division protein FtsQ
VALAAFGLIVAAAGSPVALRHVAFFRVRQVELAGVRYLSPDSVLAVLALKPDQNVFDDASAIERRAETLGGVVNAKVERKLPGTLKVSILERVPVAFAPGPDRMVALDGDGRVLPYDPAGTPLDLPVIERTDSLLVRTLSVVRLADSALFQDVDGARRGSRGGITLELGSARVLLPGIPAPEDVRTVGAVRRHLASTGRRYEELDARYEGWVVVRRSHS